MLSFIFEGIVEAFLQAVFHGLCGMTGYAIVAVVTLGRVKVSEGWAEAIGVGIWLIVLLIVLFLSLR